VVRALPLVAIAPCRLLDTRAAGLPALLAGVAQELVVVGRCGIPVQAQGVSLRLAVSEGTGGGVLTVGAAGEAGGQGGRLVLDRGQASFTTGVVGLDGSGRLVAVTETGSLQLVVEVNGYYAGEPAVRSLNALAGDVMLRAGENIAITSEGSTVTIALAPAVSPGAQQPAELGPSIPGSPPGGPRVMRVLPGQPTKPRPPEQAMVPPPSSMYVAGAIGMPATTAAGAGVLILGGERFLHNYGPANAYNTFVGQLAGNFTLGGVDPWAGMYNTAVGSQSLFSNTTGLSNTASGFQSLTSNTTGYHNTASGVYSLSLNTTGYQNTASGVQSLYLNTTGSFNTASGTFAGLTNTTGTYNTFLGYGADAAANNLTNATAIGYNAKVDASYHVRIGDTNVTQIGGQVGWSTLSDARHKENIRDLDLGLDFVLQLRPVSFTMKQGNGRTDMGFLAQDVEAVLGDDYNVLGIGGDPERTLSLRGTDLIAPMVKAIQEQQGIIEQQQGEIAGLKAALAERDVLGAEMKAHQARIEALVRRLAALEGREAKHR